MIRSVELAPADTDAYPFSIPAIRALQRVGNERVAAPVRQFPEALAAPPVRGLHGDALLVRPLGLCRGPLALRSGLGAGHPCRSAG